MIFVTVGAQMPFDRLTQVIDQWASRHRDIEVFGQIGTGGWRPSCFKWTEFMNPSEFRVKVKESQLVVAHAGMGSIITALELGKPILVMPRLGRLKETRNDHQIATAKRFLEQGRIYVAFGREELIEKMDEWERLKICGDISSHASPELITAIKEFIHVGK